MALLQCGLKILGTGQANALPSTWSLVAVGDALTPSAFNADIGSTPPSAGVVPINLTTLWVWDSPQRKWYLYAPSLVSQGGTPLAEYCASKGYLDFASTNKLLGQGIGFWVNKP